jgi:hypothetical protein
VAAVAAVASIVDAALFVVVVVVGMVDAVVDNAPVVGTSTQPKKNEMVPSTVLTKAMSTG